MLLSNCWFNHKFIDNYILVVVMCSLAGSKGQGREDLAFTHPKPYPKSLPLAPPPHHHVISILHKLSYFSIWQSHRICAFPADLQHGPIGIRSLGGGRGEQYMCGERDTCVGGGESSTCVAGWRGEQYMCEGKGCVCRGRTLPLMVPDPMRSPGRRLHPVMV